MCICCYNILYYWTEGVFYKKGYNQFMICTCVLLVHFCNYYAYVLYVDLECAKKNSFDVVIFFLGEKVARKILIM
jgi:hypothetical protein